MSGGVWGCVGVCGGGMVGLGGEGGGGGRWVKFLVVVWWGCVGW